jgi:uncharacterized membrane protein YraQ (UPF0718 family)
MHAIIHALSITGSMTWEITWALILGFALSAVIQAVVRRSTVVRLLGDARPLRWLSPPGWAPRRPRAPTRR